MKRYFINNAILIVFIFSSTLGLAQRKNKRAKPKENLQHIDNKKLKLGYFLGINYIDFLIEEKEYIPEKSVNTVTEPGFSLGFIVEYKLNKYFQIRSEPGLYFANRKVSFPYLNNTTDNLHSAIVNYIKFPLYLKINTLRYNNIRPYLILGGSYAANFNAQEYGENDNKTGNFRTRFSSLYYELGAGIEFYLEYFKFGIAIRTAFDIKNELVPDNDTNSPWTSNLDGIYTRGFFLHLTFQ